VKHALIAVLLVLLLTVAPAGLLYNHYNQPVQAAPVGQAVNCTSVQVSPHKVQITCTAAGVIVLNETFPLPTGPAVTLPPLPGPTVTLPPLPGVTVTIEAPVETSTIEVPVPGPTQSVTVTAAPGAPETITVTETVTEESSPTSLPSSTGQVDNEDGTLVPDTAPEADDPLVDIPDIDSPAEAVAWGAGLLAVLTGLALLFLYIGYVIGYKDSDSANADFIAAMLRRLKE